jgi:hypothetical protein
VCTVERLENDRINPHVLRQSNTGVGFALGRIAGLLEKSVWLDDIG